MVVIPLHVNNISNYAFGGCSNLKNVYYLGTNKTEVALNAFENTQVNKIKVKKDFRSNIQFNSLEIIEMTNMNKIGENANYFIDEKTELMVFYGNGEVEVYPDSPTSYSWYSKGDKIEHIIFEKGIIKIVEISFYNGYENYPNLNNVKIGIFAFPECLSLTTVIIKSNSFKTFGDRVFWGCTNLKTLYYYGQNEPEYNSNIGCYSPSSTRSCAPFTYGTPLEIVYVPKNYNTTKPNTFCEKPVTFKYEL
jgi:hypothetical protein